MRFLSAFHCSCALIAILGVLCVPDAHALSLEETLQSMPPENAAVADEVFTQLLNEPDALVIALCDRIVPPDQAPDAAAQFALYGLAKHVVVPGREIQRGRMARLFEAALDKAGHPDVRRFFMAQLRVCGDAATIGALDKYVCDPVLCDDAVQSIAVIGGLDAVAPLFMRNCPDAPGKDASVQNALMRFNSLPDFTPEETGLSAELLAYLANPAAVEDAAHVAALCRDALAREGVKSQYKAMALQMLVSVAGENALPDLLQAAESPEPLLCGAALLLAHSLPGERLSQTWADKLPEFNESLRPRVLAMLGRRDDPAAVQAVRDALADPLVEMRLAAYEAVTRHSGADMTGPLLDALKRADSEKEIQAVKAALLRVPDLEQNVSAALNDRPGYETDLDPAQKMACLEIIAERRAEQPLFIDAVRAFLLDADGRVRRAACAALGATGTPSDFDLLYQRLLQEERDAEADAARDALAALAKRLEAEDGIAARTGEALASADGTSRIRLVKLLAALGTPAALEVTRAAAEQVLFSEAPDAGYAVQLLETLGRWTDPEAGDLLAGFWQRLEEETLRLDALKNYIASVQRSYPDAAKQRDVLAPLAEQCRTDAEREAVNTAVARAEKELNKK